MMTSYCQLGYRSHRKDLACGSVISRYESGVHEPPYSTAVKLAEALGVPTAFFYAEPDELADLIQAWGKMSQDDRDRLRIFMDS